MERGLAPPLGVLESSYREGLCKTPTVRGLCKAPSGFVHTYIHIYAHFNLFSIDMGVLLKATIERGFDMPTQVHEALIEMHVTWIM